MKARITFLSEVCIEGKSIDEIKEKWENLDLFAPNNGCEYVELDAVEDADTFSNLIAQFYK